ncbi:MAG: hypothetical protein A2908_01355 [Candidatus Staskawiczbacteria bacterium RIFCSPLOWO2_01_FULL_38_12b]|uniref:Uncharacterized protein n=1 Tax=Candidatus Staskawiczbacteria bacterium RIFCSPLOWO2_01_FULL_38_12b TaxID=1802214 RepID=A0A1G2IGD0_9BACT|nr:MAG: hypothetical protein A2908_01355 [Candidatus Staskawiczbacteria bacterium RIFCSPLOWO2_01_FULL_38_12b]
MDTILSTNILFWALSIFVIFLTVFLTFLFVYIVLILKNTREFLTMVNSETQKVIGDIEDARQKVKEGGAAIISFLFHSLSFFKKHKKSKK